MLNPFLMAQQRFQQKIERIVKQLPGKLFNWDKSGKDEFERQRRKVDYEHLEVVQAHFTDELNEELARLYSEAQITGLVRSEQNESASVNLTQRAEKLSLALWFFERLSPAPSEQAVMNQLACALSSVERIAREEAVEFAQPVTPIKQTLRLPRPYPEPCHGIPLVVSHAIHHIILIRPSGSLQIQKAPQNGQAVDYFKNAQQADTIILTKPGEGQSLNFWE